ncbi:PH domain-containing protein [Streptomyces sp. NBC_00102]|uniref:PH domain-containing protein n=1 Tax=Streptomyces sp. NBC_00102 TaxID=2975652 RepID=UPI00225BB98C|nr:PH domain-containing protein [Streptomyces sp. NBC_00102]MCX5396251.1 PH domain-containing protein [Streptomyces sp. NBC_00102]
MTEEPQPTFRSAFAGALSRVGLGRVAAEVNADADGVRHRSPLRRGEIPWQDVRALRVHRTPTRRQERKRVSLLLSDGRVRFLPQPRSYLTTDPEFDAKVEALRALHRRHGTPDEPDHLHVIDPRTGGHGLFRPLALCALLLVVGATVAVVGVPDALADQRAWRSAVPCTAGTPSYDRAECLTDKSGVISRTEAKSGKGEDSWLYFSGSRPRERILVTYDTAVAFVPGDRVEVTFWRGTPRAVVGTHAAWHEHLVPAGQILALAAGFVLAAGYPAAVAALRVRGRGRPDDEVLPSVFPFVGALFATALWLLPLCVLHPTDLFGSPTTIIWAVAGTALSAWLLVLAVRATRVRPPAETVSTDATDGVGSGEEEEVFLFARFLDSTAYNPYGFGTHLVLGGGEALAVSPHPGPGRFAVKRVPVERITVLRVRRLRGDDGDDVPGDWQVAELDDAGTPLRLGAAPADLARILHALGHATNAVGTGAPAH